MRLVQLVGQQIRFTQPDYPLRMIDQEAYRHGLFDYLLQQW
jgi:hypothetical protein